MMEKEKAETAELAAKYGRVQSLMRYVNKEALAKSYSCQPRGKAVGVDGVTKETYGENLNENIQFLFVFPVTDFINPLSSINYPIGITNSVSKVAVVIRTIFFPIQV